MPIFTLSMPSNPAFTLSPLCIPFATSSSLPAYTLTTSMLLTPHMLSTPTPISCTFAPTIATPALTMSIPPLATSSSTPTTSVLTYQRPKVTSVEDNKKSDFKLSSCGRFVGVSKLAALPVSGVHACPVSQVPTLLISRVSTLSVFGFPALPVSGVLALLVSEVSGLPDIKRLSIAEFKKQQLDE